MKILSILFGFALIFNINYFNDIPLNNSLDIIKGSYPDPLCATPEPMTFELEKENYINDIPFNTKDIVANPPDFYSFSSLTNYSINLDDEDFVEDIPFDTKKIIKNINKSKSCDDNPI